MKSHKQLVCSIMLYAAAAVPFLASTVSCDKLPAEDGTEYLEDDYLPVTDVTEDMDGDYIIAYAKSQNEVLPLSSFDGSAGIAGEGLEIHDGCVLWGSSADRFKAVLKKSGTYSYTLRITGAGYVGYDGEGGFTTSSTEDSGDGYLWDVLLSGDGVVRLCPKTAVEDMSIAWDGESFAVSAEGSPAVLFKRMAATGISGTPEPDPDPKPDPDPTPDPDPDPEPEPGPSVPTNAKYGWFELPAINYEVSGTDLIDKNDRTLYFAHHFCAGGEKGPGGKTARNFSVCYSSEHLCPVWVAGPRHKMYTGSTKRTNAYNKDPQISCAQNGKWSGYTRGHMIGSSDRTPSPATNRQVFYYSNIAPQLQDGFNTGGGAWNNLEDHIDDLVCADTLYAVVGCYFDKFTDKYNTTVSPRTASGGDVPTMFYYVLLRTKKGNTNKAVTQCKASELQCVAFVMAHEGNKGHKPQANDMMSVSDLEKLTGFSYFPNVPNAPKNTFTPSDWL